MAKGFWVCIIACLAVILSITVLNRVITSQSIPMQLRWIILIGYWLLVILLIVYVVFKVDNSSNKRL